MISRNRFRYGWLIALAVILLIILVVWFGPMFALSRSSQSKPASDYADAIKRVEQLQARETAQFNPLCRTQLMTHGQKVERVIVFVHGNATCPQQFRDLGKIYFDQGYNVLIGRQPHHGLADRMTPDLENLTAEEMAGFVDELVDIAPALGNHVTLAGISAGGVIVAWAAQHRAEVQQAVVMSPGFGFVAIPTVLTKPAMNVTLLLPNSFNWWDETLKEKIGPPHAYPRYSTHALAQILRLGFATQDAARQFKPAARSIVVITNANDTSVNNALTAAVVEVWRAQGVDIRTFEFEAGLKLGHDFIDPAQPDQRVDIVYPRLVKLIQP